MNKSESFMFSFLKFGKGWWNSKSGFSNRIARACNRKDFCTSFVVFHEAALLPYVQIMAILNVPHPYSRSATVLLELYDALIHVIWKSLDM